MRHRSGLASIRTLLNQFIMQKGSLEAAREQWHSPLGLRWICTPIFSAANGPDVLQPRFCFPRNATGPIRDFHQSSNELPKQNASVSTTVQYLRSEFAVEIQENLVALGSQFLGDHGEHSNKFAKRFPAAESPTTAHPTLPYLLSSQMVLQAALRHELIHQAAVRAAGPQQLHHVRMANAAQHQYLLLELLLPLEACGVDCLHGYWRAV